MPADALDDLAPWMDPGEVFYIIGRLPVLPKDWIMEFELPCAQMILPATPVSTTSPASTPSPISATSPASTPAIASPPTPASSTPPDIEPLSANNATEMFNLINSIQPGYYNADTHLLGNYYGIRQQGRLVAMAGERLRVPGFSELSAICTDPAYTGRGYAQLLIAHICREHSAADIIPFLHVSLSNHRAIRLYEHMGFQYRREISFWRCRKG